MDNKVISLGNLDVFKQEYVDSADANTLRFAKEYTDDKIKGKVTAEELDLVVERAKKYTDYKAAPIYGFNHQQDTLVWRKIVKMVTTFSSKNHGGKITLIRDDLSFGYIPDMVSHTVFSIGVTVHGYNQQCEATLVATNFNPNFGIENYKIGYKLLDTINGQKQYEILFVVRDPLWHTVTYKKDDVMDWYPNDYTFYSDNEPELTELPNDYIWVDCQPQTTIQDQEISDLKAYIGYTDSDIYGLEADFENNKFTRLAGAVGKEPGADFDSVRAFGGRRRCGLANDGTVTAYYGDDDWSEPDGWNETLRVQEMCMVEQPKFYYKVVPLKLEKIEGTENDYHLRKARYYISDTPKPGFKIHPAFVRNGIQVDRIYLAAYEGCIQDMKSDVSSAAYVVTDNSQVADFDEDRLCSVANALPATGITQELTIANARKIAQNRGAGWDITAIDTISATQLLFIIEYAAFNSQAAIGDGVVNADIPVKTGGASSLGNASGAAANGAVSYRGEENLWGNTYHYVDIGNHIFDYIPTTGYISAFSYSKNSDWAFIPSETKGNTALPVGDRAQNNRLESIAGFSAGGAYNASGNSAAVPGLFCVANIADKLHDHMRGARLICIPPVTAAQNEEVTSE